MLLCLTTKKVNLCLIENLSIPFLMEIQNFCIFCQGWIEPKCRLLHLHNYYTFKNSLIPAENLYNVLNLALLDSVTSMCPDVKALNTVILSPQQDSTCEPFLLSVMNHVA